MSTLNTAVLWPPNRKRRRENDENRPPDTHPAPPPESQPNPPLQLQASTPSVPDAPLYSTLNRPQYRNGYETTPKQPSFKPYALNTPGLPKRRAFAISDAKHIEPQPGLSTEEWAAVAHGADIIPSECDLRAYQMRTSNIVLERMGDIIVVSPTGTGKSLTWTLPLLARKSGISLVITPYTTLGLDCESRNHGWGISSIFIYSEQHSEDNFHRAATADLLVIYVCVEMAESPSFARLIHSTDWRGKLSGVYIDEGHLLRETMGWWPAYARLHQLRTILGDSIPFIALSATCPTAHRNALVAHAGFHANYMFINEGNFRPELSTVVLPIEHEFSSFCDLTFVLPFGVRAEHIVPTIIYCDDLDLLTQMFWWAYYRLSAMNIPIDLVDIIHSGLSSRHQEICISDFRDGRTRLLLGSSKISAGMDFPHVERVIQYKVHGLSLPSADQRRGRGARRSGLTAVRIFLIEPSMLDTSRNSPDAPHGEDPGMLQLAQSEDVCADDTFDHFLENPPHEKNPRQQCFSKCYPQLRPGHEYHWIHMDDSQFVPTRAVSQDNTDEEKEMTYQALVKWRTKVWREDWRDTWPSYGPKSLVSDSDLAAIAKHTTSIHDPSDLRQHMHTIHFHELSPSHFMALCTNLPTPAQTTPLEPDPPVLASRSEHLPLSKRQKTAHPTPIGALQHGEMVINFD